MPTTPATDRSSSRSRRHWPVLWIVGILATTFPLVMSSNTVWNWVGKLFAWVPPHPSAALTVLLIPITWSLGLLGFFGYVVGTGILTWCAGRLLLRHRKSFIPPVLLVPLLCDIYVFVQVLPLFELPYGAQIRPGGLIGMTFLPAFGLTIYCVFYAARRLRAQENKIICAVGILIGLLPIPIMLLSLQLVVAIKGFGLEQ